jgi:hypothetical protein
MKPASALRLLADGDFRLSATSDRLNQLLAVVLRRIHGRAHLVSYHQARLVREQHRASLVHGALEPNLLIRTPQDGRHAMRIATAVVDLAHEIVRRQRDVDAALDRGAVWLDRAIPESGEGEYRLVVQMDVVGGLLDLPAHQTIPADNPGFLRRFFRRLGE